MSASTAIGMVSESLRDLLERKMTLTPKVPVTVLAPDETSGDRRVNLFLYRLVENASLRNLDWHARPGNGSRIAPPPLSLNLYYLVTAYARNDTLTGNSTAHELLGEAMRVLHEHAIVPRDSLVEGLRDASEHIKVMMTLLEPDELGRLWSTFGQPFRLSVSYEVSLVQLEPHADRPMSRRVQRVGVPAVRMPFLPPVVERLDPLSGPAGTVITVRGANLAEWPVSISIDGHRIAEVPAPHDAAVTATIPADLAPGSYEVLIDVARLHRRVFFFEVTP